MKHIDDIATKYIRPDEGTLEFALMYLPSEALYYRAFVDNDGSLMSDAVSRGVVPAGPSSLFLYLQTVAFGLRGLGLTGRERELTSLIRQLNHDFGQVTKSFETTRLRTIFGMRRRTLTIFPGSFGSTNLFSIAYPEVDASLSNSGRWSEKPVPLRGRNSRGVPSPVNI